ncbi:MAG: AAA family ATPase [Oligoflexales bacterium]|nr:AAA family ATPase [Oligoflexales bacterium]
MKYSINSVNTDRDHVNNIGHTTVNMQVTKSKRGSLYQRIVSDIETMNANYRIFPEYLSMNLYSDLGKLISSNIADMFDLVFYNPLDSSEIYLKKRYKVSLFASSSKDRPEECGFVLPSPYEFDIFVHFSKKFMALSKSEKERIISELSFKWFDFSQMKDETEKKAEEDSEGEYEDESYFHKMRQKEHEGSGSSSTYSRIFEGGPCNEKDYMARSEFMEDMARHKSGGTADLSIYDLIAQKRTEPIDMPEPLSARQAGTAKSPLMMHFLNGKSLLIASYVDSRKLIGEFVTAADGLNLTPLQWSYSDGFKASGDRYESRYLLHDGGFAFVNKKLSPFETLRYIKQETKTHTMYLLEDFHYYIKEENIAGSDFAEIISILKSLPEVLRQRNSYVVILAPTIELPPEIAPIFEVIKDNRGQRELHYLTRFGTDLTKAVLTNRIKPVIGRDKEIFECLKILSRMEANNPLLIGKSGVGKTAIVEGLAAAIVKNKAPRSFGQKRIIALNMNQILSGTKYRGEFEKRLEGLLDEVRTNSENIIVFIDEIHALLGMGQTEGSQGAENILKPVLARGEFPCIGATTYDEYMNYIAPDKALDRRFQVVNVLEPTKDETLAILSGIKHVYESHHNVTINTDALQRCVELAQTMLPNEYFPGKAIKMLDSVCASASLTGNSVVTPGFVAEEFNRMLKI